MAQKVNIVLIDDLDQSEAAETVSFGLDGKDYEIDLNSSNAAALRDALATYIASGRRSGRSAGRRTGARTSSGPSPSEIRDWAKAQGMEVSERGRISAEVRDAYDAAH